VSVYDDDTATITAKDINGKDMPIRSQRWFHDDGLGLVNYIPKPHIQQYKIEPPQATLEASTELVPVAVEVPRTEQDVALDDVYTPDEEPIKKKEEKPLSKWQQFKSKIK
jgi:hypothetical protein